jgi:autotransporter-associated beta strand protein
VNAGAAQTITGAISSSAGVAATAGRLSLGGANTFTGETLVSPGAAVVATADGALGATGAGNGTVLSGTGNAVSGVLGFSGVNYTTAERVSGVGVGNTAAVSGLAAAQRGFVQGVSGSSRFAGDIEITGSGVSRIGLQDGAVLNLSGSITPAAGVTNVTMLFRAGGTNGDFVILSGTNNSWDTDTAIFSGNNTAGQYAGVRLGASNALPTNVGVYGSSSSLLGTTLDLNGFDQKLNGLTSITQPTGGVSQLRITNLAAGGTSTLTLDVTAARSTSLTTLQEVPGGGVLALVKTGTATQALGGLNTYTGRTTVNAGALHFTKVAALYGGTSANWIPANLTVASGATLRLTLGGTTGEFTPSDIATIATNLTTGLNNDGLLAGSFLGLALGAPTTVSTVFTDSVGTGGGAVGIVKSGNSTLTLDQANTFSGGVQIIDGYMVTANNAALGTGTTTLAASTKRLAFANGVNVANPISIDVGATSGVVGVGLIQNVNAAAGENATLSGTITINTAPASGGHFASAGEGSTLTLAGPIVSATTTVTQRAGTVVYAGGGAYGQLDITGTGRLGAANGLATSSTISLGLSGDGTLDLAGYSQTLTGLARSGASAATVGNSSTTTDSILTIVGSSTFAGVIQDAVGAGTRTTGLTLNAPGQRFELTGVNTYIGPTTVSDGTLVVNGRLAATPVTVAAAGWLAGSGTIAGGVTVNGLLSPGNSPGVITLGSLVLGGTTAFEIGTGTVRGTDYDGITITAANALTYGGVLSLSFSGVVADNTTYDLFSYSGTSAGLFSSVTSSGAYAGTWTNTGGGAWQLTSGAQVAIFNQASGDLVIVPEPTTLTAALAAIGLATMMLRRRQGE